MSTKDQLKWLYSDQRIGRKNNSTSDQDGRSQYQRDFDRIIFSSSFRRLQNKTQVFSLPGSYLVHNRLTHSLEVASVGRSLGTIVGNHIVNEYFSDKDWEEHHLDARKFYSQDLPHVIAAACLCHDIGNPAFGHFGEDAIATYFKKNKDELKDKFKFTDEEWSDFINFEGNANSFRMLTVQQNGKPQGLGLTYSTLAAIAKYPCGSPLKNKEFIHRKKFGFFKSCKKRFKKVAEGTSMKCYSETALGTNHLGYYRHPFVWLVEAADDICYNIIDLEDAQRLRIISFEKCKLLLEELIMEMDNERWENNYKSKLYNIKDQNEKIAYLRSKAINSLIFKASEMYIQKFDQILADKLDDSILELIDEASPNRCILNEIKEFSQKNIYPDSKVRITQTAGYNVLEYLLGLFVPAILIAKNKRSDYENNLLNLIPNQFLRDGKSEFDYDKVMGVLDFVSGMTDNYATSMYRNIKGIDIGM